MSPSSSSITVHERSARDIAGGRRLLLSIEDGETVPGLLLVPTARQGVPAALLLHGYSSRKERMAEVIGMSLLRRGVASLAIDLPLHGERDGEVEALSYRSPFELVQRWRLAISEARLGLRFLAQHPSIDGSRLALVGYSLGSFLGVIVAAQEPLVRAVVLAAGGGPPPRPPGPAPRSPPAPPPPAAAAEPKELRWYAGGHWPPPIEVDAAVEWLERQLSVGSRQRSAGQSP